MGKPGGKPGGKWPLALGSVRPERPALAKNGKGEGRPRRGCTAGVLATLDGGGGGGGNGFEAVLKGWKGESLLDERPVLINKENMYSVVR